MFRSFFPALALLWSACEPGGGAVRAGQVARADGVPVAVSASAVEAVVVGVVDGDTITARIAGEQVKVRLHGIDAPEKGQPFGEASKRALSDMIFRQRVAVQLRGKDRWGRLIGDVMKPDGERVAVAMVRAGMAWHFVKYAPKDSDLRACQDAARKARRGLWKDAAPVAPWDWRKK